MPLDFDKARLRGIDEEMVSMMFYWVHPSFESLQVIEDIWKKKLKDFQFHLHQAKNDTLTLLDWITFACEDYFDDALFCTATEISYGRYMKCFLTTFNLPYGQHRSLHIKAKTDRGSRMVKWIIQSGAPNMLYAILDPGNDNNLWDLAEQTTMVEGKKYENHIVKYSLDITNQHRLHESPLCDSDPSHSYEECRRLFIQKTAFKHLNCSLTYFGRPLSDSNYCNPYENVKSTEIIDTKYPSLPG